MTKLLTAFAFIIVLFATCHYAKADGFYVVRGDIPVTGHLLDTTAGYDNKFTINFSDNTAYPFVNNHGGDFSEKDYGLHLPGTQAIFVDHVVNTNEWYYSWTAFNDDGANHLKYTSWKVDGISYLEIGFEDLNINSSAYDGDFDDMRMLLTNIGVFTSPVPEPHQIWLVLLGLCGLLTRNSK